VTELRQVAEKGKQDLLLLYYLRHQRPALEAAELEESATPKAY
jgi:hypothetical protein